MFNRSSLIALVLLVVCCGVFWILRTDSSKNPNPDAELTSRMRGTRATDAARKELHAPPSKDSSSKELDAETNPSDPASDGEGLTVEQAQSLFDQARALVKQKRLNDALPLLHKSAANSELRAPSLTLAGELLFALGNAETAEELLLAAQATDPELPRAYQLLSVWYYDIGAMDDALEQLKGLSRVLPEDPRPWRMRGLILKDFERHGEAIPVYEEALKLGLSASVQNEVRLELAECLLAARAPQKALEILKQATDSSTKNSLLADCWFSLGDERKAQSALEQSLEADPSNSRSLMLKATRAREKGNIQLARTTLESAVAAHPHDFDFRFHLMTAYNALGEKDKAREQQKEMTKLRNLRTQFTALHHQAMSNPKDASLRIELAKTAMELGQADLAESWFRAALSLDPSSQDAMTGLDKLRSADE